MSDIMNPMVCWECGAPLARLVAMEPMQSDWYREMRRRHAFDADALNGRCSNRLDGLPLDTRWVLARIDNNDQVFVLRKHVGIWKHQAEEALAALICQHHKPHGQRYEIFRLKTSVKDFLKRPDVNVVY